MTADTAPDKAPRRPQGGSRAATDRNLRRTAAILSEMLAHTAAETRRLQKQQEKARGRRYRDKAELQQDYRPGDMKDLTALLKDVAAVTRSLDERDAAPGEGAVGGIVILPAAEGGEGRGNREE